MKHSTLNEGSQGTVYKSVPALSADEDQPAKIPLARSGHTACVIDKKIYMYGGFRNMEPRTPADDVPHFYAWVFDPSTLRWTGLANEHADIAPRHNHSACAYGHDLIIHGGYGRDGYVLTDTWLLSFGDPMSSKQLPEIKDLTTTPPAFMQTYIAVSGSTLYLLYRKSELSTSLYTLDLAKFEKEPETTRWANFEIPTNPLTPGPKPRRGASMLPITTGQGRAYLLLVLGEDDDDEDDDEDIEGNELSDNPGPEIEDNDLGHPHVQSLSVAGSHQTGQRHRAEKTNPDASKSVSTFCSDLWTLQLPSEDSTPAKAKDATREKLGADSGAVQWSEVQLLTGEEGAEDKDVANATVLGSVGESAASAVKSIGESAGGLFSRLRSGSVSQSTQDVKQEALAADAARKEAGYKTSEDSGRHPAVTAAKSHPGPRRYFGAALLDRTKIILWGGVNAKGEREADGWMIHVRI